MFAESIHSVADTVNQIILAFGLHRSAKVSINANKSRVESTSLSGLCVCSCSDLSVKRFQDIRHCAI